MTFSRKSLTTMFSCLLAPGIQGTVRNAQLSGNLSFRFSAALGELHGLLLKLGCKCRLWFWHDLLLCSRTAFPHSTTPLIWVKIKGLFSQTEGRRRNDCLDQGDGQSESALGCRADSWGTVETRHSCV